VLACLLNCCAHACLTSTGQGHPGQPRGLCRCGRPCSSCSRWRCPCQEGEQCYIQCALLQRATGLAGSSEIASFCQTVPAAQQASLLLYVELAPLIQVPYRSPPAQAYLFLGLSALCKHWVQQCTRSPSAAVDACHLTPVYAPHSNSKCTPTHQSEHLPCLCPCRRLSRRSPRRRTWASPCSTKTPRHSLPALFMLGSGHELLQRNCMSHASS